jgi:hypothetical protein
MTAVLVDSGCGSLSCVFGLRNSAQAISQNAQDSSLQTWKGAYSGEGTHFARVMDSV